MFLNLNRIAQRTSQQGTLGMLGAENSDIQVSNTGKLLIPFTRPMQIFISAVEPFSLFLYRPYVLFVYSLGQIQRIRS